MMATKFQIAVSCQLRHSFLNYSQRSTFFLLRRLLSCTGIAKTNDSSVQKQRVKGEGPVRALQREGGQTILLFLHCQKVRYRLTCRREVLDGIGCDEFASELGATCGSPLLHQVGDHTLHRDFAAGLLDVDLHVGDKGIVQHQSLQGTLNETVRECLATSVTIMYIYKKTSDVFSLKPSWYSLDFLHLDRRVCLLVISRSA